MSENSRLPKRQHRAFVRPRFVIVLLKIGECQNYFLHRGQHFPFGTDKILSYKKQRGVLRLLHKVTQTE